MHVGRRFPLKPSRVWETSWQTSALWRAAQLWFPALTGPFHPSELTYLFRIPPKSLLGFSVPSKWGAETETLLQRCWHVGTSVRYEAIARTPITLSHQASDRISSWDSESFRNSEGKQTLDVTGETYVCSLTLFLGCRENNTSEIGQTMTTTLPSGFNSKLQAKGCVGRRNGPSTLTDRWKKGVWPVQSQIYTKSSEA